MKNNNVFKLKDDVCLHYDTDQLKLKVARWNSPVALRISALHCVPIESERKITISDQFYLITSPNNHNFDPLGHHQHI